VQKSEAQFVELCEVSGIRHMTHSYMNEWNKEFLIEESRYSDLVVISEELFCSDALDRQPNYFMEETLHSTECPVVLVPENFRVIERVAIAYDGKKESMFALRQFANLFPYLLEIPTEIVHINEDKTKGVPKLDLLREYTSAHFEAQYTSRLHFDPKKYFSNWLDNKKNVSKFTVSTKQNRTE